MKFRRRRYITNAGFQWRFVFGFMVSTLLGSVAATVVFNYLATQKLEELRWSVFFSAASTSEVLKSFFIYVNLFSLLFVAVLFIITGIIMMKKMNGPLYRIIKSLKPIGEGDFSSTITLRQKDEFGDTASALNNMRHQISERFRALKNNYQDISHALNELKAAQSKGEPVNKIAGQIMANVQNLQNKI